MIAPIQIALQCVQTVGDRMQHHTTDAAKACNVTLNTVRNWCKDYGAYLSPGATVTTGNRTFTGRDLSVLKYIALLRSEGMQKGAIVQRLGETTFPEVDENANAPAPIAPQSALTPQDSATFAPALIVAVDDLERRFALLEASVKEGEQSRRDTIQVFVLGFLAACGMFVLLLLLAVLFGGFR